MAGRKFLMLSFFVSAYLPFLSGCLSFSDQFGTYATNLEEGEKIDMAKKGCSVKLEYIYYREHVSSSDLPFKWEIRERDCELGDSKCAWGIYKSYTEYTVIDVKAANCDSLSEKSKDAHGNYIIKMHYTGRVKFSGFKPDFTFSAHQHCEKPRAIVRVRQSRSSYYDYIYGSYGSGSSDYSIKKVSSLLEIDGISIKITRLLRTRYNCDRDYPFWILPSEGAFVFRNLV